MPISSAAAGVAVAADHRAHVLKHVGWRQQMADGAHPGRQRRQRVEHADERRQQRRDRPHQPLRGRPEPQHHGARQHARARCRTGTAPAGTAAAALRAKRTAGRTARWRAPASRSGRPGWSRSPVSTSPVRYSEISSGVAKTLMKLRDQTSSKNAMVTPCMTRVKKSQNSTAPSRLDDEIDAGGGDAVQVARDESPQHDVDRHPGDHRQHPRRAAAHQVELAQRDGARSGAASWRRPGRIALPSGAAAAAARWPAVRAPAG